MSFPAVGFLAKDLHRIAIEEVASKLGITIKYASEVKSVEEIIEFSKNCDLVFVEPKLVSIATLRSVEQSGVKIFPSLNTLEQLDKISKYSSSADKYSILVARSAHSQISTWPISLLTENLTITPAPGMTEELANLIHLSAINLASDVNLIGTFELLVDANDFNKLVDINWLNPTVNFAVSITPITNYFEQLFRAILDLPLGFTVIKDSYVVSGKLRTDPSSDDYRPYLHLMARNPMLKFNQLTKEVAIYGNDLEKLLTEVIHAQQYYSGEVNE
jgi:phosphoribosylaminoimidazole carboxylase (NCAIR synthetase)